ncbi:hypothetical protein NXT3_PB00500 (plasmid) [Sinorhizobium fredii]|uniref:Uncharacterized protein n=1 Tax=Rhizobium fredii TaxID=380 RepID=A0A2L0HCC1_RHIFR|nr:hypothetical protein NXT3_PB00500 [Sinorhizobium fredii]
MGGFVLVAAVVLVLIAKQWRRISATLRQLRNDFEAAGLMRAKDNGRDKADLHKRSKSG